MDGPKDNAYSPRKPSPKLTPKIVAKIKALLTRGFKQHDIAAMFGINQGRVSEINTGRKFVNVKPEQGDLFD
jgi:hypothetical protein